MDLSKFGRKLRDRWYFRDEPLNWKPPSGYPCAELFLSKLESELFSFLPGKPQAYKLIKKKWLAKPSLAEDPPIIIKPAHQFRCSFKG